MGGLRDIARDNLAPVLPAASGNIGAQGRKGRAVFLKNVA